MIQELREKNQNIKIKKDRLKWIIIIYIMISCIIYFSVPLYLRQKYLQNKELSYNQNKELIYCNVSFYKGKIVGITNETGSNGYLISKYLFELTNGEKITISGYNKEFGETYNICIKDYYKKDTNQLFKTDCLLRDNSNIMTVCVDNTEYIYDYIGNQTFKFNFLSNDNIINWETKIYYSKTESPNTLYNFINSGENMLTITDDFYIKEYKSNNYETIKKIGTYISEYGRCYILKANSKEKIDYLMYIENKNKKDLNEIDGILLNSPIDRTGSFQNDEDAMRAFKIICSEKQ